MFRRLRLAFRMLLTLTGFGRGPDFLIIGAQKAGTTSLFRYISDLGANFIPPEQKELYFFTENYNKGLAYYKSKFPLFRKKEALSGEATPDYLLYPLAPERVKAHFPDVRIVVILRDPVARAHSQYRFQNGTDRTHAYDKMPFEQAISTESDRYSPEDILNFRENFKYYSYEARGRYAEQLKRWFAVFPREQILIMELGELKAEPSVQVNRLFRFIGIKSKHWPNYPFKAANKGPKKKLPLAQDRYLRETFAKDNETLFTLIGRRFNWSGPPRKSEE